MRLLAWNVALFLLSATPAAGPPRLHLAASPAVCFSPCPARITLQVDEATEVDWVDLAIEGSESYRSQVNMSQGRRTYELHLTLRGDGDFQVYAVLYRRSHAEATAASVVTVKGV